MQWIVIFLLSGLATGWIARKKGSSFFMWFVIGCVAPFISQAAVILYRREHSEPERPCPRCGYIQKLYVQVCTKCGEDMYLPELGEVRPGPDYRQPAGTPEGS